MRVRQKVVLAVVSLALLGVAAALVLLVAAAVAAQAAVAAAVPVIPAVLAAAAGRDLATPSTRHRASRPILQACPASRSAAGCPRASRSARSRYATSSSSSARP